MLQGTCILRLCLMIGAASVLAACGASPSAETMTVTAPASTQAATTEAARPVFYAGNAAGLLTQVHSFGEGWAENGPAQTTLVGEEGVFVGEQPKKRSAPLATGLVSIANQDFILDDGLATKGAYHTVIVYASDEDAQAALDAVPGAFTSKPSWNYAVKEVNPPLLLGSDARAVRGTHKLPDPDFEVEFGLVAWRQANIVQAVAGRGLIAAPNALISRLAKAAYRQTEATLANDG